MEPIANVEQAVFVNLHLAVNEELRKRFVVVVRKRIFSEHI